MNFKKCMAFYKYMYYHNYVQYDTLPGWKVLYALIIMISRRFQFATVQNCINFVEKNNLHFEKFLDSTLIAIYKGCQKTVKIRKTEPSKVCLRNYDLLVLLIKCGMLHSSTCNQICCTYHFVMQELYASQNSKLQ